MSEEKLMSGNFKREFAKFKAEFEWAQQVRKDRKRIRDANYRFNKLTPTEKRVRIAKDVLAQLGKKIVPTFSTWTAWAAPKEELTTTFDNWNEHTFQKGELAMTPSFASDTVQCNACALGAAFVCAVRRADDLKIEEANLEYGEHTYDDRETWAVDQDAMESYLERFFDHSQLRLIELAFERGNGGYTAQNLAESKAAEWRRDLTDPGDRMRAVMENIVKNGGTFKV